MSRRQSTPNSPARVCSHSERLFVAAGQQADEGREARPNDVGGTVQSAVSAGRIERLLRSTRSFSELRVQKGECVILCDEQSCSFPTLSEQESRQARQMDTGEIEVGEERRVSMKRVPVLPTDKDKDENENMHVAIRSQCKT